MANVEEMWKILKRDYGIQSIDELKAAANAVQAKINNQGAGNATVDNPADMTGSLMNPNFNGRSTEGWKGSKPGFGNSPHPAAEVAEFYNTTFNMYQDLKNMPHPQHLSYKNPKVYNPL